MSLGKLDAVDLNRIARITVIDRHIEDAKCSDRERELLLLANERARSGAPATKRIPKYTPPPVAAAPAGPVATDAVVEAAKTGDLASAINNEEQK
jgi:hypothetical protein